MEEIKLGAVGMQFAELIWQNEPLHSRELVRLCEEKFCWKKSTTYTMLKKLCDQGLFRNQNGTVSSLISKAEFFSMQSESFVENSFGGSLPAFIAAFTSRKSLSAEEIDEICRMIGSADKE